MYKLGAIFLLLLLSLACSDDNNHSNPTAPSNQTECVLLMSQYGDFGPRDIRDWVQARDFCRRFGYTTAKNVRLNTDGPNAGFAYRFECCK